MSRQVGKTGEDRRQRDGSFVFRTRQKNRPRVFEGETTMMKKALKVLMILTLCVCAMLLCGSATAENPIYSVNIADFDSKVVPYVTSFELYNGDDGGSNMDGIGARANDRIMIRITPGENCSVDSITYSYTEEGYAGSRTVPCELSKDPSSGVVSTFFSMPCGNYGSKTTPCRCTPKEISRYLGRISGPLLDRIDIQLEVTALAVKEITETPREESSDAIRERVQAARERQQARFREEGISCNAQLNARQVEEVCVLDDEGKQTLERACEKYHLSMRAVSRVLKVARTIADLAGREQIEKKDVLEAVRYRNLEGGYWK